VPDLSLDGIIEAGCYQWSRCDGSIWSCNRCHSKLRCAWLEKKNVKNFVSSSLHYRWLVCFVCQFLLVAMVASNICRYRPLLWLL
jgi:hypothetical protein